MARYTFCILIGTLFLLIFGVAKGEMMQGQHLEMAAFESVNIDYTNTFCQISSNVEQKSAYTDFDSAFDGIMATDIKLCEGNLSTLSFTRNISVPKTLKLISTIRILSSLNTRLPEEKGKNLYSNINYVKCSCRYFVYTLRSIII